MAYRQMPCLPTVKDASHAEHAVDGNTDLQCQEGSSSQPSRPDLGLASRVNSCGCQISYKCFATDPLFQQQQLELSEYLELPASQMQPVVESRLPKSTD